MVNRPKQIGTDAERAVAKYLVANGFPHAERRALKGRYDCGDVTGIPGVVVEVKGGATAKLAAPGLVVQWLEQTRTEVTNAKADVGVLVLQRRGYGLDRAGYWWAIVPAAELTTKIDGVVWVTLGQVTQLLRHNGYGDPL